MQPQDTQALSVASSLLQKNISLVVPCNHRIFMYLIRHFREKDSNAAEETQPGTQSRIENQTSKLHFTHNTGAVQLATAQ